MPNPALRYEYNSGDKLVRSWVLDADPSTSYFVLPAEPGRKFLYISTNIEFLGPLETINFTVDQGPILTNYEGLHFSAGRKLATDPVWALGYPIQINDWVAPVYLLHDYSGGVDIGIGIVEILE